MPCGLPWAIRKDFKYRQYLIAFIVGILHTSSSMALMSVSPILSKLTTPNSNVGVTLTYEEASWVVSILGLGMTAGSILLGVLFDRLGPKRILLLSSILYIISWICFSFDKYMSAIVAGRFVAGMGEGIAPYCCHIYVCEIASKDIRGRLATIHTFMGLLGNVLIFTVGPYLEYMELVAVACIFPIIFLFSFLFIPDSPYFLIKSGKRESAKVSLSRLSNLLANSPEIEANIKEIENTIKQDKENESLRGILLAPNFIKSLVIAFGKVKEPRSKYERLFFLAARGIVIFCGFSVISSYLQVILQSCKVSVSNKLVSVIFGFVGILGSKTAFNDYKTSTFCLVVLLSWLLIDKLGRKPIFYISSLGASIAIIGQGIYSYLQDIVNLEEVSFIPIVCLTLYKFWITFGVIYLPLLIVGELFSTNNKKYGAVIISCCMGLFNFINNKIFGSTFLSWGIHTMCWFFGAVLILGVLFAIFILPETKGRTLYDIQKDLEKRNGRGSVDNPI